MTTSLSYLASCRMAAKGAIQVSEAMEVHKPSKPTNRQGPFVVLRVGEVPTQIDPTGPGAG